MNKNAERWIEALRSGEYTQAKQRLRKDDSFCCLGVACDLYIEETGKAFWDEDYYGPVFKSDLLDDSYEEAVLPEEVSEWLGLKNTTAYSNSAHTSASEINDGGATFNQIANFLEEKEYELFA